MVIIAKTEEGVLISATKAEVEAILKAVSKPIDDKNPIKIGDKIPAYDYAGMIQQCKVFKDTYDFKQFKRHLEETTKLGGDIVFGIETLKFE